MSGNDEAVATANPLVESPAVSEQAKGASSNKTSDEPNEGNAPCDESETNASRELTPPPLPPRPLLSKAGSLRLSKRSSRPQLLSTPTTALSLADVHTQSFNDNSSLLSSPVSGSLSRKQSSSHLGRFVSSSASEAGDSASLHSYAPALSESRNEQDPSLGEASQIKEAPIWETLEEHADADKTSDQILVLEDDELHEQMEHEFDRIDALDDTGSNEDAIITAWRSKLKHFFILSASGKPIYSRHGDDRLTGHYIGMIQTLLSFYETSQDSLRTFTAGPTRFVVLSKGPLYLVATSRVGESDTQLRNQLESMYMQILSTLTLPSLERIFSNRPSTDLRRPLQGTDALLDGLADGFTRGSPSTLLSALECLRLRKTERKAINETLLKVRSPDLLYGLIVAAGRLVSVVRPKKHSLHPGDLQLIFNMLFEANSIKAGGGENWIPLCLPGFNNTGFLYMYVSFFHPTAEQTASANQSNTHSHPLRPSSPTPTSTPNDSNSSSPDNELAIILITANKEAFYSLQQMRDALLTQLTQSQSLGTILAAMSKSRPLYDELFPPSHPTNPASLHHFLYKSRPNVQFTMPSLAPSFATPASRRALMTLYARLHDALHTRSSPARLNVVHALSSNTSALAWETPLFELYCVAGADVSRQHLALAANRVVQWAKREEERVFIIGGAVF